MGTMEFGPDNGISNLDFTYQARASFKKTVKDPYFRENDYDLIFRLLKNKMRIVEFGDFLKRYIYTKAELSGDYHAVPIAEYQEIICNEFADRQTPCSFTPTTMRLRNAAKLWLERQTVNRNVVLLLGYGLGMDLEDVNSFLTKALQEPELNAKDPFEVICWYCFRSGLSYLKFDSLWKKYQAGCDTKFPEDQSLDYTVSFRKRMQEIRNEIDLFSYLSGLPIVQGTKRQSMTARVQFDKLYAEARKLVADLMTEAEKDSADKNAGRLETRLSHNDRMYDCEKLQKIRDERAHFDTYSADDIVPADIENVILSAVPKDMNGNLVSMKDSSLNKQFTGKRLSRQHLGEILSGKAPITRYDLITLHFFVLSQKPGITRKERYIEFVDSSNGILELCGFGPIYVVNPYECFLLLCILSEDPLGTYADVWERSYQEEFTMDI